MSSGSAPHSLTGPQERAATTASQDVDRSHGAGQVGAETGLFRTSHPRNCATLPKKQSRLWGPSQTLREGPF